MAKKLYDMAVKIGSYTDRDGNSKNRYQNIGVVIQGDDGPYMLLDRHFNPAGIPNPDNRSNVLVSLFKPRENNGQQGSNNRQPPAQQQSYGFDDDIPFG